MKYLGGKRNTSRGFGRIEFSDIYGAECSIQESSLATKNALWLGCDHETIHETTGEKCGARMHVDLALAKRIVATLQKWIDTGRL
jgi:hypothetical protein